MTAARLDLDDWERDALGVLPPMVAGYYAGGARDEATLAENRAAWGRWRLVHRILSDVREVDVTTTAAGLPLSLPVMAAPTAFHGLAHPEAERATARGVAQAGTAMCLSTLSNAPVEAVVAEAGGAVLFQLYVYKDRGATDAIVDRVREAGCKALVLTADAPILGTRLRDVRNGFRLPEGLVLPNAAPSGRTLESGGAAGRVGGVDGGSGLARYVADQLDRGLGWADLERFLARAGLPVWLKGVVRADDAARAAELGVAGIVVSNHGGRQLDGEVSTAEVLPGIVDAVAGRAPVWIDGGVRRGSDVVRAVALGAAGVLVGRPILWGLAVAGADGVREVLDVLRAETIEAMTLMGAPRLGVLGRSDVVGAFTR